MAEAISQVQPPADPVIECNIQQLWYGSFKAVRDTRIPIQKNSITAFIGPSGCGKSPESTVAGPRPRASPNGTRSTRSSPRSSAAPSTPPELRPRINLDAPKSRGPIGRWPWSASQEGSSGERLRRARGSR
jgi:hypothetical protein